MRTGFTDGVKAMTHQDSPLGTAPVGKLVLQLAIPAMLAQFVNILYSVVDRMYVGHIANAGDAALAAVGSCVALVGIFVNLIVGLSVGPNAVLALLIGQNSRDEINRTLHTVLTFGAALGAGLMLVGWLSARPILVLSGTPESVLDEALLYIFIYFLSIPFMVVYNFGAAVLRSYGDSRRPMYYLLLSGTVNVVLNLFLVIVMQLGVAGVAIATVISNVLSAVMVITHLIRRDDDFAFRFRRMRIEKEPLLRILQIGIPAGIQGAIFSVSNVFIQSGINSFGENAIAGSSLALNFEYFTYDIANAFAQAAVTFTSQNFGAGDIRRCKRIFRLCLFTEILCAVFMVWVDFFVSIYTSSSAVAVFAVSRMRHVCSLEGLTATYEVESASLRGMGRSLEPAVFTILGTVVFRLIWMATVFRLFPTYEMLMNVYPASWIFTGAALLIVYVRQMRRTARSM